MFRTVTVYRGEKLSISQNRLVVTSGTEEQWIPLEDLYSVIIDNHQTVLTTATITALTGAGAHVIVCDEKHLPASVILPQSIHYHPLSVIRKQIGLPQDVKDSLWDQIVRAKIANQAKVLKICGGKAERVNRLLQLTEEVREGDEGNREGIAARIFFHELYGFEFVRMSDDATNAALNYGYTVIRSAVAKTLTAYGYNCVLGIHHINEANPFNLADDIMEPLRPIVDLWVYENRDGLIDALTKQQKNELAALVNALILWDGKRMRVRNAVDKYVSSFTTAINRLSPPLLKIPEILPFDLYNEEDD